MERRLPIIGVMGAGSDEPPPDEEPATEALGRLIAERGWHLLTGGGKGAMTAVARGFCAVDERRGLSIGILPIGPATDYPNDYVELPIRTHLSKTENPDDPMTRNHINVLTGDALIFRPGGMGTLCELELAQRHDKPRLLYLGESAIGGRSAADLSAFADAADTLDDVAAFLGRTVAAGQTRRGGSC